jgi:hypothetical protein
MTFSQQLSLELDQLALSVTHIETDPQVLALACLAHIARKAIADSFGEQKREVSAPLIALGDQCLMTYADRIGVQRQRILSAIQHLDRASEVYCYLAGLPE